jgi:hypothetical protein
MIQHFFSVPNRANKITRLPLFETFENTNWRGVINTAEITHQSQFHKVYSMTDLIILNVRREKSVTIQDKQKIKDLLAGTVFCIVGLFIRVERSRSKVYYLVMLPSANILKINLFLIQKHRDCTNTIDKRMLITENIQNLSDCNNWAFPHDLVCDVILPDENQENLWFQFFVPRPHQIQIIGNLSLKDDPAKIFEYNRLTGKLAVLMLSGRQIKRKENDKKKRLNTISSDAMVGSNSLVITDGAFQILKASDDYDAYMKEKRVSGIRSADSGGRVALYPLLIDKNSEMTIPVALSEMHIVTTIKDVFKIEHTFTTITSAIEKFELSCKKLGIIDDSFQTALAAVASVFLEDVSWRMVAEESVEHFLKTLKVDIDQVKYLISMLSVFTLFFIVQVSLHIKKLNIYNFENEMDSFLSKMYTSLIEKVYSLLLIIYFSDLIC